MDFIGDRWDILASIALAGHVERIGSIVRVDLEELGQARIEIASNIFLRTRVTVVIRCETVAGTNWIIDEDQMIIFIPGDVSVLNISVGIDIQWADLREQREERGSTRATLKPEQNRCIRLITILCGKEPEEHVGIVFLIHG